MGLLKALCQQSNTSDITNIMFYRTHEKEPFLSATLYPEKWRSASVLLFQVLYVCKHNVIFNSWENSQLSPGSACFSIQTEILRNGKWFSKHKNGNIIETGNAFCLDCKSRAQILIQCKLFAEAKLCLGTCFEFLITFQIEEVAKVKGLFILSTCCRMCNSM